MTADLRSAVTIDLAREVQTHADPDVAELIRAERRRVQLARIDVVRGWEYRRRSVHRALHDGAQQQLLGLRMELLRAGAPVDPALRSSQATRFDEIIGDIDRLAHGFPLSALTFDDIAGALAEIASQCGMPVDVDVPVGCVVSAVVAELLAFTVSEGLANAVRHAGASRCQVSLRCDSEHIELTIGDDGRGGVRIARGRGLDGLRQRAVALGGDLTVCSGDGGSTLVLTITDRATNQPDAGGDDGTLAPSWSHVARHQLRALLGDDGAEIAFEAGASDLVDEHGELLDTQAEMALLAVRVDAEVVAFVRSPLVSPAAIRPVLAAHPELVHAGRRRARAAVALRELLGERNRVARRAATFESALARRLTNRPLQLLAAARTCFVEADDAAGAAVLLLSATDALREIVSALNGGATAIDGPGDGADPFLFGLLADQAGVDVEVHVVDVPTARERDAMSTIGEEIILDSTPGASVRLRITSGRRRATMTAELDRLPSPRVLAFIEDISVWLEGFVTCKPHSDGVRLRLELPCAS